MQEVDIGFFSVLNVGESLSEFYFLVCVSRDWQYFGELRYVWGIQFQKQVVMWFRQKGFFGIYLVNEFYEIVQEKIDRKGINYQKLLIRG